MKEPEDMVLDDFTVGKCQMCEGIIIFSLIEYTSYVCAAILQCPIDVYNV